MGTSVFKQLRQGAVKVVLAELLTKAVHDVGDAVGIPAVGDVETIDEHLNEDVGLAVVGLALLVGGNLGVVHTRFSITNENSIE